MIIGHYAASFLGKAYAPDIPLWHLVLAAQLIDFVWASLILVGVESSFIVPGATKAFPFDFSYIPYSHSVVTLVLWTAMSYAVYGLVIGRKWGRAAQVFAVVVASHWFADLLVHKADLPLTLAESVKYGWGWWDYPLFEFLLEMSLLVIALYIYSRANSVPLHRIYRAEIWMLVVMIAIRGYFQSDYYTHSMQVVAGLTLLGYSFFVWLAYSRKSI
jgi:hypothetical protein